MSFRRVLINTLNTFFKELKLPIQIKKMFFFRPAYFETYHEHFEPIEKVERLFECNPVYLNVEAIIDNRESEYDIKYKNENKRLSLNKCLLKYCDYEEHEEIEEIKNYLTSFMKPIASIAIPGALNAILKNM